MIEHAPEEEKSATMSSHDLTAEEEQADLIKAASPSPAKTINASPGDSPMLMVNASQVLDSPSPSKSHNTSQQCEEIKLNFSPTKLEQCFVRVTQHSEAHEAAIRQHEEALAAQRSAAEAMRVAMGEKL